MRFEAVCEFRDWSWVSSTSSPCVGGSWISLACCCLCVRLFVCVRGDDSARWPNSIPLGGVAQVGLLIPVISSEFGVDGGGVEQKGGHGSGTSRSGL